jgi:homoserine dehydrogenase
VKLLLVGFGVVGQGLAEILMTKGAALRAQYGFNPVIVGVGTRSHGTLYHPDGLELDALLAAAQQGGLQHYAGRCLQKDNDIPNWIRTTPADVLVEASITNLQTGQPATDYCRAALETDKHVVLANKGPIALHYAELQKLARYNGLTVRFEGTVMAGTPSLTLAMEALAGCTIHEARGILNGTTNFILTQMTQGMDYATALAQAQQLGYAEADPTADVDGWDAAGKLLILAAALYGKKFTLDEISVTGITGITPADIEAARQANECYKLIARITPDFGSVSPQRIPLSDPLAAVSGATNAITYKTDLLGDVTLVGAGAGRLQTGFALLADLIAIHRQGNIKAFY